MISPIDMRKIAVISRKELQFKAAMTLTNKPFSLLSSLSLSISGEKKL